MDLLIYSTKSFTDDRRGAGIRLVRIVKASEGEVILDIPDHGRVDEGVIMAEYSIFETRPPLTIDV